MNGLAHLVHEFVSLLSRGQAEIYNEISLQLELGLFLRERLPQYKVQFERNVGYFGLDKELFTKKEVDISIFTADRKDLIGAIELKFPRNGQYPEQIFKFCNDVAFAEELYGAGFTQARCFIKVRRRESTVTSGEPSRCMARWLSRQAKRLLQSRSTATILCAGMQCKDHFDMLWSKLILRRLLSRVTLKHASGSAKAGRK